MKFLLIGALIIGSVIALGFLAMGLGAIVMLFGGPNV